MGLGMGMGGVRVERSANNSDENSEYIPQGDSWAEKHQK